MMTPGRTNTNTAMWPCGCVYTILKQECLWRCPTHTVGPAACCPKAHKTNCVCMYSYDCPEHGQLHIGSHE